MQSKKTKEAKAELLQHQMRMTQARRKSPVPPQGFTDYGYDAGNDELVL